MLVKLFLHDIYYSGMIPLIAPKLHFLLPVSRLLVSRPGVTSPDLRLLPFLVPSSFLSLALLFEALSLAFLSDEGTASFLELVGNSFCKINDKHCFHKSFSSLHSASAISCFYGHGLATF